MTVARVTISTTVGLIPKTTPITSTTPNRLMKISASSPSSIATSITVVAGLFWKRSRMNSTIV